MLMAAMAVMTIPIIVLFFLAQRNFIQGITLDGAHRLENTRQSRRGAGPQQHAPALLRHQGTVSPATKEPAALRELPGGLVFRLLRFHTQMILLPVLFQVKPTCHGFQ